MREKAWKVTPRAAGTGGAPEGGLTAQAVGPAANDPEHPADEPLVPPPLPHHTTSPSRTS
jgi:hypothetical protein